MSETRSTIVRLLSNMGSAKEIQQYLKRFSQVDAARFAVVKVGGAILRDELEALVSSLAFLQQVGLTPIVVHGAGPQLDERMAEAGIAKKTVDGLRVTDAAGLAIVRRVSQQENLRLVEALRAEGKNPPQVESVLLGDVPRHNVRGHQQVPDAEAGHGAAAVVGIKHGLPEVALAATDLHRGGAFGGAFWQAKQRDRFGLHLDGIVGIPGEQLGQQGFAFGC